MLMRLWNTQDTMLCEARLMKSRNWTRASMWSERGEGGAINTVTDNGGGRMRDRGVIPPPSPFFFIFRGEINSSEARRRVGTRQV